MALWVAFIAGLDYFVASFHGASRPEMYISLPLIVLGFMFVGGLAAFLHLRLSIVTEKICHVLADEARHSPHRIIRWLMIPIAAASQLFMLAFVMIVIAAAIRQLS